MLRKKKIIIGERLFDRSLCDVIRLDPFGNKRFHSHCLIYLDKNNNTHVFNSNKIED